ncbi:MAG: hypothetical protein AAGK74_18095, partial [Chloroflexota bacterium]
CATYSNSVTVKLTPKAAQLGEVRSLNCGLLSVYFPLLRLNGAQNRFADHGSRFAIQRKKRRRTDSPPRAVVR